MTRLSTASILVLLSLASSTALAATSNAPLAQPKDERAAQKALPQSKSPVWDTLRKTKIGEDDKRGLFTASFPDEVKALSGQSVTLTGFMLPLDTNARAKHFLLSKYTPVCFFCPPGQPNEVVEVTVKGGVPVTDRMLNVTGRFALQNQGEKGLFFRMDDAVAR